MQTIIYNSSLPRSGGTLLQNVLAQNSDIYASNTSLLLDFISAAQKEFSIKIQYSDQSDVYNLKNAFYNFCSEGMKAYCHTQSNKPYFIDKNFNWGHNYDFLQAIQLKKPKIILMIRDLRDIFCSMEENYRRDPLKYNMNVNWNNLSGTSMQKRVGEWMTSMPVGHSLEKLLEIVNFKNDKNIHIVKYEDFCEKPQEVMNGIYDYIGMPKFIHDFDNIKQVTKENDVLYFADHKIRPWLSKQDSRAKDILQGGYEYIYEQYKWFFEYFNYKK
jgi:sulfotransferase